MTSNVCVVGSANMDLVVSAPHFPTPGETVMGSGFAQFPGGKGANQAVAASRLGAQVRFVGVVGEDDWGSELRSVLTADGVGIQWTHSVERLPTGVGVITVLPDGQNSIVVAPGANAALGVEDVDAAGQAIRAADVLVIQGEVPAAANRRAVEIARDASTFVLLNAAPAVGIEHDLLGDVDLLVVNVSEARVLLSIEDDSVSPGGLARRLATLGPERVVLTLGEEGALHFDGAELMPMDAFEVESVDGTGAGDAFIAALAVLRGEGRRVRDCMHAACAAGALAVSRAGAIPSLPTRKELDAFLEEREEG